jgi:hypothetical protein
MPLHFIILRQVTVKSPGFFQMACRSITAWLGLFSVVFGGAAAAADPPPLLAALASPLILRGDEHTAYRDPLIFREGDTFYLFYTLVREEEVRLIYYSASTTIAPASGSFTARTSKTGAIPS